MPNATDLALAKADVEKLANLSRLIINIIAGILALAFAFLALNQTQVVSFIDQADVLLFYRIGLAVYYAAWVFGTKFDVDIEERVYIKDTARGLLDWKAFGILVIFTAVMAGFFWLHYDQRLFALGLLAFIVVNIVAWRVLCARLSIPVRDSLAQYTSMNDHFGAEKVRMVDDYVRGDWQKRRFALMLAMAAVFLVLVLAIGYFDLAERFGAVPVFGITAKPLIERAPAIFFLLYIVVAEGWIWVERINIHHCINVMDRLAAEFRMVPRAQRRLADGAKDATETG